MFEFVLDLALDWDNVEDYTQYAVEEPQVIEQRHQAIVEMPVDVVISESPPEDEPWFEFKYSDPVDWDWPLRWGGVSSREAEERLDRVDSALKAIAEGLIWIGEQSGEPAW